MARKYRWEAVGAAFRFAYAENECMAVDSPRYPAEHAMFGSVSGMGHTRRTLGKLFFFHTSGCLFDDDGIIIVVTFFNNRVVQA